MKMISYISDETYFAAGRDVEDARHRAEQGDFAATPLKAWDLLGYWDKEENYKEFEVFKFHVTEKITQVEAPYSS